jgi:hypothetical protein
MDIVTAIFVSNVKILASIRLKGNNDNIKVKIPTCDLFVHSIYIETAQQIFYEPFLFYHRNNNFAEIQKNKKYVRELISYAVDETIRQMMPFDHILQEYLKNALEDNAEYTDSESEESEESDTDVLNNDKVIEEPEEEPEEEPDDTEPKQFNLNLPSTYPGFNQSELIPKPIEQFEQMPLPQPLPQSLPPPPMEHHDLDSGSDSGSDSYSDSSSDPSSGSSSDSSSGSDNGHRENRPRKEHRDRHAHHGHRKKNKYSFF